MSVPPARQQATPEGEHAIELGGRQILGHRVRDDEVEAAIRQLFHLLGRQRADARIGGEARRDGGAHAWRLVAQQHLRGDRGHPVGMDRLAAAIVEHARARARHEGRDLVGDLAVVHVLVAGIDVDRMGAVPEGPPVGHRSHSLPLGTKAGASYRARSTSASTAFPGSESLSAIP